MNDYLEKLNPNQRAAVETTEGPLLVLAGAGSGKTTVLAGRITYILQNRQVMPWNILAITFTNKAANEMRNRIEQYIGEGVSQMWIGTFHSICIRILRTCIDRLGYKSDFVIYDTADSRTLMKECMKDLGVADDKGGTIRSVLATISSAKNEMVDAEDFAQNYASNPRMRVAGRLYAEYQKRLKQSNALDFDDIILLCVKALRENDDVREKYHSRFKYILVDECQDTNNSQYELIRLLTNEDENICVVGDDDQSIYRFRGANVENILGFEKDYKGTKRITLDENYRSTSNILNAANAVISNNGKRMGKNLWTKKDDGDKISTYTAYSEKTEGEFITREIHKQYRNRGKYSDCAILYRTNSQSRAIEEACMLEAIPYKVLAGQRFYDRKEIKDIVAYLRVVYNPSDTVSIKRIINEPKRKIGDVTINKIQRHAIEENSTFYDVIMNVHMYDDLKAAAAKIRAFGELIRSMQELATTASVDVLTEAVLSNSGYKQMLIDEKSVEAQTRLENLEEFVNVAHEFAANGENDGTLSEFLEKISLVSDIDGMDDMEDCVVLMTIHSAKGLEFPVVFLSGMEEDLFPSGRSMLEEGGLEEERRLCYVAITRAKEKLYMTRALSRFKFGTRVPCDESRFMREIPDEYKSDESNVPMRARQTLENVGVKITPEFKVMEKKLGDAKGPAVGEYDFHPGDRVRHRKFGDGKVISAQAFGRDAIVVIDFDTVGAKRLMAAFAKLELIERGH